MGIDYFDGGCLGAVVDLWIWVSSRQNDMEDEVIPLMRRPHLKDI
jgi:hypothetical protein